MNRANRIATALPPIETPALTAGSSACSGSGIRDSRAIVAAITHDAWTVARAGAADSYEWRAAVERIAHAWDQLSEPEANR